MESMNTLSTNSSPDATGLAILVVEDNRDTRDMVCELLRLLGHQPVGVGNAEQALMEVDRQSFDILFTDISLPGMSGIELAKKVALTRAGLRIILASGYYVDQKDIEGFNCKTLLKPYDLEQLQAALHDSAS